MNLDRLRAETRPEHEATESVMPRFDGAFGREEYVSALVGMYGAVRRWDEWAGVWAPEDLREMVRGRQRGPALERDLEFFGVSGIGENPRKLSLDSPQRTSSPGTPLDGAPGFQAAGAGRMERTFRAAETEAERRAAFLGMMYVVEGSTLGGQYIARRAEEVLGLTPGEGDAFFRGAGAGTGERWRAFKAVLAAVPEEHTDVVIAAAKDMFAHFHESLTSAMVAV